MRPIKKTLSDAEKYRLFNIHLKDKMFRMEKDLALLQSQIAKLQLGNIELRLQLHEQKEVNPFFGELGISRKDGIELSEDGTLTIQKPDEPKKKDKGRGSVPEPDGIM